MNNLADIVAAAGPYLSAALISAENLTEIVSLARRVPAPLAGVWDFECRLGETGARADFLIRFSTTEGGREILAGRGPAAGLSAALLGHAIWSRLYRFCREWTKPTSILCGQVRDVWLEFDTASSPQRMPLPSVFFGPQSGPHLSTTMPTSCCGVGELHQWVAKMALPLLLGHPVADGESRKLLHCLSLIPTSARVYQVGVMLSRQSRAVRLCICGMAPEQIPEYLRRLGWAGPIGELKTVLARFAGLSNVAIIDIDVSESVHSRIGLECSFHPMAEPEADPRWKPLLDHLVATGLCLPEKRDAVLAWPGYAPCVVGAGSLPESFLRRRIFGGMVSGILVKRLSHVKLVFQPDQPLEAKVYLSCKLKGLRTSL